VRRKVLVGVFGGAANDVAPPYSGGESTTLRRGRHRSRAQLPDASHFSKRKGRWADRSPAGCQCLYQVFARGVRPSSSQRRSSGIEGSAGYYRKFGGLHSRTGGDIDFDSPSATA